MLFTPWPLRRQTLSPRSSRSNLVPQSIRFCANSPTGSVYITLQSVPDLQQRHSAGLFHFAILVPDRLTLGSFLRHAHVTNGISSATSSSAMLSTSPVPNTTASKCTPTAPATAGNGPATTTTWLPLDLDELAAFPDVGPTEEWTGFPLADDPARRTRKGPGSNKLPGPRCRPQRINLCYCPNVITPKIPLP